MTIYSFGQQDTVAGKKTGLERDRLIDVLQALVTVALWLRLDWLLLSAWSDARALIAVGAPQRGDFAEALGSAALCWLVVLYGWIVWKLDRIE